jgi:hypothetical protein
MKLGLFRNYQSAVPFRAVLNRYQASSLPALKFAARLVIQPGGFSEEKLSSVGNPLGL